MDQSTAEELAKAIEHYPAGRFGNPKVDRRKSGFWVVHFRGEVFTEIPRRLELTEDACGCHMPACSNGKVASSLLDTIRTGGKVSDLVKKGR